MRKKRIVGLIIGLIMVVLGAVLFMVGISNVVSDTQVNLDSSYYCNGACDEGYLELGKDEYEELINKGKSFVVFVDQSACDAADRLRTFTSDYFPSHGVKIYRMMFSELKESSLHEKVKYYPSLVVISNGKVRMFLRADADEDADMFNEYDKFVEWVNRYIYIEFKD